MSSADSLATPDDPTATEIIEDDGAVNTPIAPRPGRGMWDHVFQLAPGTVNLHVWKPADPASTDPSAGTTPDTTTAPLAFSAAATPHRVIASGQVHTRSASRVRQQNPHLSDWQDDIEQWVVSSPAELVDAIVELRIPEELKGHSPEAASADHLTTTLAEEHQGKKLGILRFQYKAFPSRGEIVASPSAVPSGRTAVSYWVWTSAPGANRSAPPALDPKEATGALYREIDTATGTFYDCWVLFSTYQMPNPGSSTWIARSATGWTSRRNFLASMGAFGSLATRGWYVPVGGMDVHGKTMTDGYPWIDMPEHAPKP